MTNNQSNNGTVVTNGFNRSITVRTPFGVYTTASNTWQGSQSISVTNANPAVTVTALNTARDCAPCSTHTSLRELLDASGVSYTRTEDTNGDADFVL